MWEDFNPWWFGEKDRDLEVYESLEYKYLPRWIKEVSLGPGDLNFVIGGRRTGKTLGMKLLIRQLLQREKPWSVFYCSCDVYDDYREIYDLLKEYKRFLEERELKRAFVFLDEITLIPEWWRGLKTFLDTFKPPWSVTVGGSLSLNIQRSVEYFGGRRGKGNMIEVLPLNFRDYADLLKGLTEGRRRELFERYLRTGGYLAVLNRQMDERDVIYFLKSDLKFLGKDPSLAKEILCSIFSKAPSPISFHSIAKDIGVSTRTVQEYVYLLRDLFYLLPIPFRGKDGRIVWRKDRKYAIRDPFAARSLGLWTKHQISREVLLEWIVQEHLFRVYGEVYYYRNSFEVDAVSDNLYVEVKKGRSHRRYPSWVKVVNEESIPEFLYGLSTSSTPVM